MNAMKTIVAAIDFSNATSGVLRMGLGMAKAHGAELILFHAVEPQPSYTAYGFTPEEFPAMHVYQEEAIRRAGTKLEQLAADLSNEAKVTTRMVEGSPLHTLLDFVNESAADMVILGTHGHGVIASLLLGSVAEGMVRKSTVPTLIVPAAPE